MCNVVSSFIIPIESTGPGYLFVRGAARSLAVPEKVSLGHPVLAHAWVFPRLHALQIGRQVSGLVTGESHTHSLIIILV